MTPVFFRVDVPVAGVTSEVLWLPVDMTFSELVIAQAVDAPSVNYVFTLEVDRRDGTGFTDLNGAVKYKLPAGSTYYENPAPPSQSLPATSLLRLRNISAGSNTLSPPIVRRGVASGTTGNGTPKTITVPLPAAPNAPQIGDRITVIIGTNAVDWLPSGDWTKKADSYVIGGGAQRLQVFYATYSATLSMVFTAAGGGNGAAAYASLVHYNTPGGDPFDLALTNNTIGATTAGTPTGTVGSDNELAYYISMDRLAMTAGGSITTGKAQSLTPVTGLTSLVDVVTTRPAPATGTQFNVGLKISEYTPAAAGAVLDARIAALTGGAGAGADTNWAQGLFSIKSSIGTPAGGGVVVQTMLRPTGAAAAISNIDGGLL